MKNFLFLLLLWGVPSLSFAAGGATSSPSPSWRDEGDTPLLFNIACTTYTWTVVVASDTIRRAVTFEAGINNSSSVCLSTSTDSSACGNNTTGYELSASASLTDYSHIKWLCQGRSACIPNCNIQGATYRDKRDTGWVGSNDLQ